MKRGSYDQLHGGSFNGHKHWKKLRDKHRKQDAVRGRGIKWKHTPEIYKGSSEVIEGQTMDISKELYDLNYDLAFGKITEEEYNQRKAELEK
jgi:hypothetical protein